MSDYVVCPLFIVEFARSLLKFQPPKSSAAVQLAKRMLIYEIPDLPVSHTDIRRFEYADTTTRICSGIMLGRWLVSESSEYPLREPTPDSPNAVGVVHELAMRTVIINFAIVPDNLCILEVINMLGKTERLLYKVIETNNSVAALGEMIGVPQILYQNRSRQDLCLPAGWKPSLLEGQK